MSLFDIKGGGFWYWMGVVFVSLLKDVYCVSDIKKHENKNAGC